MAIVSQKRFLRGINAAVALFSQPQGIIARASNMLYNIRGSLKACDGSKFITRLLGVTQTARGPFTEIVLYQPVGVDRYYVGFYKDPATQFAAIGDLAVVDGGAGGTLPAATYFYKVTSIDGAGGESTVSNEVSIVNAGNRKNNLSWTAVPLATGYRVYRGTASGAEVRLTTVTANSYSDDNTAVPSGEAMPTVNTTQTCFFTKLIADNYGPAQRIKNFPADLIPSLDGTPGAGGGGGGGSGGGTLPAGSSGGGATPSGGISGNVSALPQLLQFVNKVILCLGNGYPIWTYDGAAMAQVVNTFNAQYPNWFANTNFSAGSVIKPVTNNAGGYLFKALQGGVTGAGNPAFPQNIGDQVADNSIQWQNVGQYTGAAAPRGAAHGLIYAGSLWVANTSPTTTSDGLDGPSAIRMSDVNNPNSWNPLNAAHLSKDDGDQIMGMALFTISEQGVAPTGSLIVFKSFSTFQILGVFGSSNFSIQQAKTDLGCIASRTIQFLPGFGVARLTHLGVAIFNGVGDQIISEEIRPYLFDNVQDDILAMDWNYSWFAKAAQTANPPMYVLAIPVALPTISGLVVTQVAAPGSTLTAANYYVRVTKVANASITKDAVNGGIGAFNEAAVSTEFGPIAIGANQGINVVGPALDTNHYSGWRIYFGYGPGLENQYVFVTDLTGGVTISAPGASGLPSVGVGALTRLLCYDLVLKAWAIIDLPFSISVLKQFRATGTIPITVTGGYADGSVRRLQSGDPDFDGVAIEFSFRTPEVYAQGGTQKLHYRRIIIKGVGDGTIIQVAPRYDGTPDLALTPANYGQGTNMFDDRVDLLRDAESAAADIYGTGMVELDSVDWDVREKPMGSPPIFS